MRSESKGLALSGFCNFGCEVFFFDYDAFAKELGQQGSKRFLVGQFQEDGYYAIDPDSQKGFWIANLGDGDVQGRGGINPRAAESLMEAAKRRGLA